MRLAKWARVHRAAVEATAVVALVGMGAKGVPGTKESGAGRMAVVATTGITSLQDPQGRVAESPKVIFELFIVR